MRLFRHSHWAACLPLCCWLSVSQLPSTCSLCAGVICSGGSGDDGGEPPGCAAADSAVHHEQVSLCGDIQRTTLSPVHCWDNGQLPLHAQVEFTDISELSKCFKQMCPFSFAQGEYVSCLLSLLQQMTEIHFHHLLNNFHSKEELKVRRSESQSWMWLPHFVSASEQQTLTAYTSSVFPSVGVPAEDLLRVPQPDETDHLSSRLECHEASNKPVSPLFCHAVFVPERVREYSQPLDQSLFR